MSLAHTTKGGELILTFLIYRLQCLTNCHVTIYFTYGNESLTPHMYKLSLTVLCYYWKSPRISLIKTC